MIVIVKSRRELIYRQGGQILLRAPVQLGFGAQDGAKLREGDGRTPEGRYRISSRNPMSRFHLSLGISYPNREDALRGLREGVIDRETFEKICLSPDRPPWDTAMGGFIMIHGQPPEARSGDWTAGCVALSNADMDRLFALAEIGTEVEILP